MAQQTLVSLPVSANIRTLVAVFIVWKVFLLCIACASPGPGYDTSTELLLPRPSRDDSLLVRIIAYVSSKLVRWDALYFIRVAQRGHLFEQEWAFGWGWMTSISFVAKVLPSSVPSLLREAAAGIIIAHVFHLFSVLALFALTLSIIPLQNPQRCKTAFLAALLHVVSPAGMFLSAPYAETLFAFLNITGMWFYSCSYSRQARGPLESIAILGSGLCWGLASTIRGNGILSGIVLAYRALMLLKALPSLAGVQKMVITVLAGIFVASGNIIPQWIAYQQYCIEGAADPRQVWCSRLPPSILSYVQAHYWNNGFLKYWTLSNVPLFLLALPLLCLMFTTSLIAIVHPASLLGARKEPSKSTSTAAQESTSGEETFITCIRLFALPQAALTILTFFNLHVQIINRLSSGYPVWYIVIAMVMTSRNTHATEPAASISSSWLALQSSRLTSHLRKSGVQRVMFFGMIIYAMVQGGLYASFMPPA